MKTFIYIFLIFVVVKTYAQKSRIEPIKTKEIANLVLNSGLKSLDLSKQDQSLLMHDLSELAFNNIDPNCINQTISVFADFKMQKIKGKESLISYEAVSLGIAYLNYLKKTTQFSDHMLAYTNNMFKNQKNTNNCILTAPWLLASPYQVMINKACGVTPYMRYAGLVCYDQKYTDQTVFKFLELLKILRNTNGLQHKARGFQGNGSIIQENLRRGNGLGDYALEFLTRDLYDTHLKKEVNVQAKNYFENGLNHENDQGLWHQEMNDTTSYVGTSESGLILFALGVLIEKNIFETSVMYKILKGLQGYTSYIDESGSISQNCGPCLSPKDGAKADYMNELWFFNDYHSFDPAILAFAKKYKLGAKQINSFTKIGYNVEYLRTPRTVTCQIAEANGNILCENDRKTLLMYKRTVKDRLSSEIDEWIKCANYPLIKEWYKLNDEGKEICMDRDQGCDFYHVGFTRENGGTALWSKAKNHILQTNSTKKFLKNTAEKVTFGVNFEACGLDGFKAEEKKIINMRMGKNFFQVISTSFSDTKKSLIVITGINYDAKPEITPNKAKGSPTILESYMPQNGELDTSVILNPCEINDFKNYEKQQFVLVSAKAIQPIT